MSRWPDERGAAPFCSDSSSEILYEDGSVRRVAASANQAPVARPGKVDQLVPVEVRNLYG